MPMIGFLEQAGRRSVRALDEAGYATALFGESLFWTLMGPHRRQPVRIGMVVAQMMEIGILALPIATMLSAAIGFMLAVQSLYSLGLFGAESFAHVGIALALTREFSPLIVGILVAGRSGSALAARLSSMTINQEVDALRAIGINPVRYLVAPALLAMLVMLPALTMWSNLVGMSAAGLFVSASLETTFSSFVANSADVLSSGDLTHGLVKSAIFAVLIAIVASVNGSLVAGGADGVGRVTTRAVVHAISAIIVTDMIFGFLTTR
jgi:phospholipid/cholesterol/gamma-HCH transport system permease protein